MITCEIRVRRNPDFPRYTVSCGLLIRLLTRTSVPECLSNNVWVPYSGS